MKKIILISALILLSACSNSSTDKTQSSTKKSEAGNPYSYGSGYYAGYEWAERNNIGSCSGNSDSFIEGCETYLEQINR